MTTGNERDRRGDRGSFPVVGVGASAGGLEAFTELLKHLPLDTGMGFVLVQHLDPQHESALTHLLGRATSMPVREVTNNLRVEPNCVYVIPPNTNLGIAQGVLKLQPRQKTGAPHRSIDFFFESLAQDQRECAIGVILSGTATDGTVGLEAIKAEDGITFAQDESARYDSMPRSAAAAGCVDFVLSPENIAKELARIAKHPYVAGHPTVLALAYRERASTIAHEDDATPLASGGRGTPRTGAKQAHGEAGRSRVAEEKRTENGFKKIILLLRNRSGVDFSLYKPATIRRRIVRRMVLNRLETLEHYARLLNGNTKELDNLYSDLLIGVTSFFRNPEAFHLLKTKVFPKLLQSRGEEPLRVWVLGCSTGQEAYSIAMTFVEAAEKAHRVRKLQVFATDLNESLLDKARHGHYAKSLANDISPERLRRFFVEEEGGYRVSKPLREMVVFARQNVIEDPPFSRMDLVTCRNLLIYLEPVVQKKALAAFHYALKPEGFLFLGASESIGAFTDLFAPADKKHKIYSRKAGPTPAFHLPLRHARGEEPSTRPKPRTALPTKSGEAPEGLHIERDAQREADRVAVGQFAPPGVLINADLQILQFRGATSAYLAPPTGKASFDVLKMAREGLMLPLRAAINKAKKENKTARKENARVEQNGDMRLVNVEVIPLKNLKERHFLIVFEDATHAARAVRGALPAHQPRGAARSPSVTKKEESRRIAELETDLTETRDYAQSIQEQYEAANEQLQSANEEIQSANEELQSINEELETSKEELESANEELITINEEMVSRNAELNRVNSDLTNFQNSTRLAVVLLGRDLTVRRFSAQAEKQLNLVASDIGRPIGHIHHNLVLTAGAAKSAPDLETFITTVIDTVSESECEVRNKEGRWYSLRVRPYFTAESKVDGAVLVLVDINELKRSEQAIAAARDYAEGIVDAVPDPLVVLNADLRVHATNEAFYKTFKVSAAESQGHLIYELGNSQWAIPKLRELLEGIQVRDTTSVDRFEITHDFQTIGRRTMLLNARWLRETSDQPARILLGIQDVTDLLHYQAAARENAEKFMVLFEQSPLPKYAYELETLRFTDVNEATVEHYGYSRDEFQKMTVMDIRTPEAGAALKSALPRSPYHPSAEETCTHRKRSGEIIDVELSGTEIRLSGKRVWLVTVNDITRRKQTEQALRESEERLKEAGRHKDEFMALLAHELRGPLAPLSNMLELMKRAGGNEALVQQARSTMERQLAQMTRLIEDLMDVNRISQGRLPLHRELVELASVIHHAVEACDAAMAHFGHELIVNVPPQSMYVDGDRARLAQVFSNLLINACKYSDSGSTISLTAERQGAEAIISIKDTGIGIAPDMLPRIFGMFVQADRYSERSQGGLGMGLALVRQIAEMHGGSVTAFSEGLGRGSQFVVHLPVLPGKPEPHPSEPITSLPAPIAHRILVVDDNRDAADSLSMLLKFEGHETHLAHDGLEAIEAAAAFKPNVVLLDIGLPQLNGYEVARRIRQQPWGKAITLIALTGWGQDEDRRKSKEAGFNAHLVKPVDHAALSKLLTEPQPTAP